MADSANYTVGWICALRTEFIAAKAFLDEKHDDCPPVAENDNNSYALGRMGSHNVVIAVMPNGEYGTTSAAAVARDMLHSFPNVRIGLMVGIGGGAPSPRHDVRLGDVVVSSPHEGKGGVFQHDFGKAVQGRDLSFQHTGFLNQPPMVLRAAVSALESRYEMEGHQLNASVDRAFEQWPRLRQRYSHPPLGSDRLYRSDVVHPNSPDGCSSVCSDDPAHLVQRAQRRELDNDPEIHYGLIASGNSLMKDATIWDTLAAEKGVLCFEMEAAGLMNHFPCLVIRGICDYSDSHKNKEWQGFAAMMAAAYAKDLLSQIPPSKVEAEGRIRDALTLLREEICDMHQIVHDIKTTATATQKDERLAKLSHWLSAPDPSTNAARARERRHAGTGTWLLESATFREWEAGERQHLWLYGLSGCGKTVLSTTILDHLKQKDAGPTISFFFDFDDTKKQTLEDLLRSLAVQLFHSDLEAAQILVGLFKSHNDGWTQPSSSALTACVESMLRILQNVTIVVDAIDECITRLDLLSWIRRFGPTSNINKTKLIMTGQPEVEFRREIPRLFGKVNCTLLDKDAINVDIRSYVAHELHQRLDLVEKEIPHNLLQQILRRVGDGAEGMFRWAACQLDTLAKCLHSQAIEEALEHLPPDLNETYKRMLQNIPPELKSDAIRLLQFLVHSKRPLTPSAAIDIIATQIEGEQPGFKVNRRLFHERNILRYCSGLVVITNVRKLVLISRRTIKVKEIHLAHFSVKQYLICNDQFKLPTASIAIAKTCLVYLKYTKGTSREMIELDFPLALRAAEVWMDYARLAEHSEDVFRKTLLFFQDKAAFKQWLLMYDPDGPRDNYLGRRPSRLYYACRCGLLRVSRSLLDNGADVDAEGGYYGNALRAASANGHHEIVQLLIDRGADVNAESVLCSSALEVASESGHLRVIQLLLDGGADVNTERSEWSSALQIASGEGHLEIVQLLLDRGANDKRNNSKWASALYAAAERGNLEVARLLLDRGANDNRHNSKWASALYAASDRGHLEVVQLLLDRGTYADAGSGYFGNALQAASAKGHTETAQLLRERSAAASSQASMHDISR